MPRLLAHQFFSTKTSKCIKRPSLCASAAVGCWWTSATDNNNNNNVRRWVGSNVQFSTHNDNRSINWWHQQRNNDSLNTYILMHQLGTQQIITRWHSSPTQHYHDDDDDKYARYKRYQMARKEALNSNKGPDMRNCTSIDELATLAYNNLNDMGHRDISAFWTLVSQLLLIEQRNGQFSSEDQQPHEEKAQQQLQQLLRQINSVYMKTMDDMSKFAPRELAQTALAIARIINTLNNSDKGSDEGRESIMLHEIILRGILIGNNNTARRKDIIFQSIAKASVPRLWKFDPHCLCNLAYAYAIVTPDNDNNDNIQPPNDVKVKDDGTIIETSIPTLLKDDEDDNTTIKTILFHHIAKKSMRKLKQFNSQDISNMVWSFAKAGVPHPQLFEQVGHLDNLHGFSPQGVSNTVWAYAHTHTSHPILFERVATEVIIRQPDFNSQEVANLLWAFACTGQLDIDLFTCLESKVIRLLPSCNAQEMANIAWSYSVANVAAPSLFNDDFIHACIKREDEFTNENLSQLHQWQLWQRELDKSDAVTLPSSLQEKCYNAFVSAKPTTSKLQEDVTYILRSLGLDPQSEVLLTNSGYRLDALVQVVDETKKSIYIEVDGPFHFLFDGSSETRKVPAGSTILKHRQVRSLDVEENGSNSALVSIPYWEWYAMNDIGKKQQYLCSLLGLSFDK